MMTREVMGCQPGNERIHNFEEVALGYTKEQAVAEAKRCIQCKTKPCMNGCPVEVNIPSFIEHVANEEFDKAYEVITESNALPAICGRVCPQENQCEGLCIRGIKGESIAIGNLERYVADYYQENIKAKEVSNPSKAKVGVIGSGPAGLACAGELVKHQYDVTIFEALHEAGGVLTYGIPEFRLPQSIVEQEVHQLIEKGVKLEKNQVVGMTFTIEELMKENGFEAMFIGTGAGLPRFLNIPGENLNGVYSANEFLTRINLMKAYDENSDTPVYQGKKVVVVGGGNVAMDAARSAKRLGAEEVSIVYRRSFEELPARKEEIHHAKEEGITFNLLRNPKEILSDENFSVNGMKCSVMELGEMDESGRRRPVEVKDKYEIIECDSVILAIGTSPNPLIRNTTEDLDTHAWGGIITNDETGETSIPGVYAGGDVVTGAATVIMAMGAGKKAGVAIHSYLSNK